MFRRNKSKASKARNELSPPDEDMVALTGPGMTSSSSGMESAASKKGKGKGFLGRKKKRNGAPGMMGAGSFSSDDMIAMQTQPIMASEDNSNINVAANSQSRPRSRQPPPPSREMATTRVPSTIRTRQQQPQQQQRNDPSSYLSTNIDMRGTTGSNRNNAATQSEILSSSQHTNSLPSLGGTSNSSNVISNAFTNKNSQMGAMSERTNPQAAIASKPQQQPPNNMMLDAGGTTPYPGNARNNINAKAMAEKSVNEAFPMMRTGWSMQSNASSAMSSGEYIQSLETLPSPSSKSGKGFPILSTQPDETNSNDKVRRAISRQFGRAYPPQMYIPKWKVKVSPPKWSAKEKRHKYKINITANSDEAGSSMASDSQYSHAAFTSTSASRSLQDFMWLERALRTEYQGALLAPLLSFALYFGAISENEAILSDESLASRSYTTDATGMGFTVDSIVGDSGGNAIGESYRFLEGKVERNEIVDEAVLANWLSDVINGVRGDGEVILNDSIDVVYSEGIETFLYRQSDTTKDFVSDKKGISSLGSPFNLFADGGECRDKSLFESWVENSFECFGMSGSCGANQNPKSKDPDGKISLQSMMCSSGTTGAGVNGIQTCNSRYSQGGAEIDFSSLQTPRGFVAHSELLEAERGVIESYLKSTSLALSKVQSLTRDEVYVGQCWKRFAVSLSSLFAIEKDLEQAHIGDAIKSNKKNQPFRKLRKSAVDDALSVLARGKIERANPALRILRTFLSAFFADLNMTIPSFKEYSDAINHMHQLDEAQSIKSRRSGKQSWLSSFEQLKAMTWGVTQQMAGGATVESFDSDPSRQDETSTFGSMSTAQTKAFQSRVLANEKTFKYSLTSICKASPLRNARMAWWYLKTEAKQALKVHTAATTLRQKLSLDSDTALAMKGRKYEDDDKKDNEAELGLVKRILDIGSSEHDDEASRQNVISIATEQAGRWNAKTALALMEAAGIADAEVQIDETSRELRHVRKYAITLRENVAKCLEAAEALASVYDLTSKGSVQIAKSRREFWASISVVFSGKIMSGDQNGSNIGSPSTRVLSRVGVDISDRGGWLGHNARSNQPNEHQRSNCGEAARQYLKKRDNQASVLLSRIVKLLKDYEGRLESIESFVYMHCVSIQLEKHYSKARSKALSAWEKRTDISTAINVATKKKIPKLVQELKVKLDALPQVSYTTVLKRKEEHLTSKTLKMDLQKLANRRFGRAQEVSTERVIAVMSLWAKHEESVAIEEVKAIGEAVQEIESSIQSTDVDAALNPYSFSGEPFR